MTPDARTASPSPLTPPSILADEAALKRVFDAEFPSSLASAQSQLGDATALAPRVVETSFVSAWNQRATIQTPEQLKAVLTDEIRHGAARALSRRASAGRLAGGKHATGQHATASAAPADVWAHVEKAIHARAADTHAAADAAGRHEAASHMKDVAKKKSWAIPIAIGVIALVISVAGVLYVDRLGEDEAIAATVGNSGLQPLYASNTGQIGSVTLGDSTKMRIGPDTRIYVPDGFPTKIRAVKVDGTVQFDVAPVSKTVTLPFHVVAKRTHVIATGTSFGVSAYANDSGVMVKVKEGSVTVKSGKSVATVGPGQALLAEKGTTRAPTPDELVVGLGWLDGQVSVQHKPLRAVVGSLARWFNFDVKVPDLALLDRDASFNVPLDSSRLAISQVEQSANVKFQYEGETRVFRDAGKSAATSPKTAAKTAPKSAPKKKK